MSAPLRFLTLAVVGWAALRGATLGLIPGAEMFSIGSSEAAPPPPSLLATDFPPIDPLTPQVPAQPIAQVIRYPAMAVPVPYFVRAAVTQAPAAQPQRLTPLEPIEGPVFYSPIPRLDDWPLSQITGNMPAPRRSAVAGAQQSTPRAVLQPQLDRLRMSAWALLRGKPGPDSLASGGTLGGSQAGARLTYHATPWLAGSLRTSSPIGGARGGEVAAGVRVAPFRSIPVALTAERRQAIGEGAGRSAFALFLEGGVYRPMPWKLQLEGYAQGGVVGARSRDLFVDGGISLMRPLYRDLSAGVGVWGGAQPGLYRVDAGPRLSMRVRGNMRVHLDWRQRMTGNAAPGSGPALTLAGDF